MIRTTLLALITLLLGGALPAIAACTDPAGVEVDWKGCDVGAVNLSEANLSDATLIYTRLKDANLSGATDVLWVTDKRGRDIGIPAAKIAYVEVGSADGERRIGFGG